MSENEYQVIMVQYLLIYVGTKDLLTFIHSTYYFKPSVSNVKSLCKVMSQSSSLPDEDFEEIAEHMSALKLVSVISLVQLFMSYDIKLSLILDPFCDLIFRTTLRKLTSKQCQLPLWIKGEKVFLFQTWKNRHH